MEGKDNIRMRDNAHVILTGFAASEACLIFRACSLNITADDWWLDGHDFIVYRTSWFQFPSPQTTISKIIHFHRIAPPRANNLPIRAHLIAARQIFTGNCWELICLDGDRFRHIACWLLAQNRIIYIELIIAINYLPHTVLYFATYTIMAVREINDLFVYK